MSDAKYFVWAGARWRELDGSSGSVAGWRRRARFVYVRHGRLRVASRRRVLAALQALLDGRPSAAGLGPRLSVRSAEAAAPQKRVHKPAPLHCQHRRCCTHTHGCNNNNSKQCGERCEPAPLVSPPAPAPQRSDAPVQQPAPLRPKPPRAEAHPRDITRPARRAPPLDLLLDERAPPAQRRRSDTPAGSLERALTDDSESQEECKELTISESDVSALRSFVARTRRDALRRFDRDDLYKRALFYAINPLVSVVRCPRTERALRERSAGALPHFAARLGLAPADHDKENSLRRSNPTADDGSASKRALLRHNTNKAYVGGDRSGARPPQRRLATESKRNSVQTNVKQASRAVSSSDSDEYLHKLRHDNRRADTADSDSDASVMGAARNTRNSLRKKNITVIEDSDSSVDDSDEDFKSKATPSAERRESLRHKVQRELILKPSDTRHNAIVTRKRSEISDSDSGRESEQRRLSLRRRTTNSNVDNSEKKRENAKPSESERERAGKVLQDNIIINDSDSQSKAGPSRAKRTESPKKPAQSKGRSPYRSTVPGPGPSHTISKRASASGSKEYSNLEDHAIVAWVSGAGRARKVNGNSVWRELQQLYPRLAGRSRSWHSLRNRYLRYILPSLGALRLPPGDESRLRAAAATGEIKRKRSGVTSTRRNSIFHEPTVSAASARLPRPRPRPRPPRGAEAERASSSASPPPRATGHNKTSAAPAPRRSSARLAPAPPPAPPPARTRKLFNPKVVM